MMKQRKVPLRKCTGCQEMKDKRELIRIVRNDAGEFSLDRTGKKPGRGAYICPNTECLAKAQKSKGLERSFKAPVPKDVYEALLAQLEGEEIMRKFYSLLGLCKRANKVAGGEVAAEEAIRGKKACLVIVAGDASANTKKKFHNSASFYEVPILELGTKADLGRAVGEEIRAVLVVTEAGFAAKLQQLAQTAENAE